MAIHSAGLSRHEVYELEKLKSELVKRYVMAPPLKTKKVEKFQLKLKDQRKEENKLKRELPKLLETQSLFKPPSSKQKLCTP